MFTGIRTDSSIKHDLLSEKLAELIKQQHASANYFFAQCQLDVSKNKKLNIVEKHEIQKNS